MVLVKRPRQAAAGCYLLYRIVRSWLGESFKRQVLALGIHHKRKPIEVACKPRRRSGPLCLAVCSVTASSLGGKMCCMCRLNIEFTRRRVNQDGQYQARISHVVVHAVQQTPIHSTAVIIPPMRETKHMEVLVIQDYRLCVLASWSKSSHTNSTAAACRDEARLTEVQLQRRSLLAMLKLFPELGFKVMPHVGCIPRVCR